jgi:hypothetical protein
MNKILIILLILFVFSSLYGRGNTDAKKSKKGEVILFSAVKGNISLKGQPLEGIKLSRTYPQVGKIDEITETVYTDEMGNFVFEEVIGNLGIMRLLPHEAVISQTIKAEYSDQEYLLWYTCRRNYRPLGELKYGEYDPILSPQMSEAYNEGYILLNCDLENSEEIIQRVNDNILGFISIIDFQFPHDLALKDYSETLILRENEFTSDVKTWFEQNPQFIERQISEGSWDEMELEGITPYKGAIIESVESVHYSDHIKLGYFEEDYNKDSQRVTISGHIILNVINPKGESLRARLWMSDALFEVSENSIELKAQDHYFGINSYNIDPNVIESEE